MNHGIERVKGRCRLLGQLRTDLIYPLPVPLVPVVNLDKRAERGQLLPQRRVRVVGRVTMGRVERIAGLGLWKLRPPRGHWRGWGRNRRRSLLGGAVVGLGGLAPAFYSVFLALVFGVGISAGTGHNPLARRGSGQGGGKLLTAPAVGQGILPVADTAGLRGVVGHGGFSG